MAGSGNKMIFTFLVGVIGGVVVSHVFKSKVNHIWSEIPYLNKIPAND